VFGQKAVVEAEELGQIPGIRYFPDVAGKVLIDRSVLEQVHFSRQDDSVTVFPNWPVAKFGSNERGGVYCNLDFDPELELVYSVGQKTYAFNINGTSVAGWPRTLDYPADGAPAFGDVDGDGFGEIVVTTHQTSTFATGTVYAFEINGTNVFGFPVTMEGGPLRTPVLADLDGDGADEIVLAVRKWPEGFIHVYRGNGTMSPNFPVRMEHAPGSAVAVGDITGDDVPEIVAESYYTLHAFNLEGALLSGFPYSPGDNRVFSYSSPVLADLDGDGQREIICGDHSTNQGDGAVHIVRSDGTAFPGWPKLTDYWIYGPPSVGDIDGDGTLDITVGDQVISPTPSNKVYSWNSLTGEMLPGFPITGLYGINSQVILADLDADDQLELIFDDNAAIDNIGRYPGYNHDGTPMENWPLETQGTTFFINPMVVDINLDGILDISGAGTDQNSGNTYIYLWNSNAEYNQDLAILPILQYNTRHNGVYGDHLMVGTKELLPASSMDLPVFPNPVRDNLTVGSSQFAVRSSAVRLAVMDLTGRILIEKTSVSDIPFKLNVSSLKAGMYIFRWSAGDGHSGSSKFIKAD
jgi:hypothetical protein